MIYVFDGDSYCMCKTVEEAKFHMSVALTKARKAFRDDGEWPEWTESICAYDTRGKSANSDDDPMDFPCTLRVTEINSGAGFCEYTVKEVSP